MEGSHKELHGQDATNRVEDNADDGDISESRDRLDQRSYDNFQLRHPRQEAQGPQRSHHPKDTESFHTQSLEGYPEEGHENDEKIHAIPGVMQVMILAEQKAMGDDLHERL